MFFGKSVFKMYVKSDCPYCDKDTGGHDTVPAIYIGDQFIGGCDDLCELVESREIEKKILIEENCILREEIMRLRRGL